MKKSRFKQLSFLLILIAVSAGFAQKRDPEPTQAVFDLVKNETMKNICAYRLLKFTKADSVIKDGIYLKPGKNVLAYIDSLLPDYNQKLPLSIDLRYIDRSIDGDTQFYMLTFNADSVFNRSKKSSDIFYKKFFPEKEYRFYVAYIPRFNRMIYISGEFYHSKIRKGFLYNTSELMGMNMYIDYRTRAYSPESSFKLKAETETEYIYQGFGKIAGQNTFLKMYVNKKYPEIVRMENVTRKIDERLKELDNQH
jgi:hypothetical protein